MTQQLINIGLAPNDRNGDPARDAYDKCNQNFTELYQRLNVFSAHANGAAPNATATANTTAIQATLNQAAAAGGGIAMISQPGEYKITDSGNVSPLNALLSIDPGQGQERRYSLDLTEGGSDNVYLQLGPGVTLFVDDGTIKDWVSETEGGRFDTIIAYQQNNVGVIGYDIDSTVIDGNPNGQAGWTGANAPSYSQQGYGQVGTGEGVKTVECNNFRMSGLTIKGIFGGGYDVRGDAAFLQPAEEIRLFNIKVIDCGEGHNVTNCRDIQIQNTSWYNSYITVNFDGSGVSGNNVTVTGHPFATGDRVRYDSNGNTTILTESSGTVPQKDMFTRVVDANTITFHDSRDDSNTGDNPVGVTASTGTHVIYRGVAVADFYEVADCENVLLSNFYADGGESCPQGSVIDLVGTKGAVVSTGIVDRCGSVGTSLFTPQPSATDGNPPATNNLFCDILVRNPHSMSGACSPSKGGFTRYENIVIVSDVPQQRARLVQTSGTALGNFDANTTLEFQNVTTKGIGNLLVGHDAGVLAMDNVTIDCVSLGSAVSTPMQINSTPQIDARNLTLRGGNVAPIQNFGTPTGALVNVVSTDLIGGRPALFADGGSNMQIICQFARTKTPNGDLRATNLQGCGGMSLIVMPNTTSTISTAADLRLSKEQQGVMHFLGANVTIDFTQPTLIGNGGVAWTPAAGDAATFYEYGGNVYFQIIDNSGG